MALPAGERGPAAALVAGQAGALMASKARRVDGAAAGHRGRGRAVDARSCDESLHRIRQHPFITTAQAGLLTQEQAERWILCAGRESRSFPAIIENMLSRSTNARIQDVLRRNLEDEYGNGNAEEAHFRHYLHLLDDLGIPRMRFHQYEERAGIQLALSLAYNVSTQKSESLALGYMLVNEGMTAITYSSVRVALQRYYPLMNPRFFQIHVDVDECHVEDLYQALTEVSPSCLPEVLFGVSIGERGMAVLLDEALGVFDHCTEIPA